jgi:hypothetical protein
MRFTARAALLIVAGCTTEHTGTSGLDRDAEASVPGHDPLDAEVRDAHMPADDPPDARMASHDAGVDDDAGVDVVEADGGGDVGPDAAVHDSGVSDSQCDVTVSNPESPNDKPKTNTWSYDPATRRLVTTVYAYDLDDAGRTLRVYGNDRGTLTLYWTNHYDEHGNIDSYEHYTAGVMSYTNTYDGDTLVTVDRSGLGGSPGSRTTYRYDDPAAPKLWTRSEVDSRSDGSIDALTERTIVDGRTSTTRLTESGMLHHEFKFSYSGARIDTIDRDGGYWLGDGPDGTPNMRFHWSRDEQGNLIEFTQDGTDSTDNPFLNGTPDYKETFSKGCAPLLAQFPWLAHDPAPNSIGPRFRDDQD